MVPCLIAASAELVARHTLAGRIFEPSRYGFDELPDVAGSRSDVGGILGCAKALQHVGHPSLLVGTAELGEPVLELTDCDHEDADRCKVRDRRLDNGAILSPQCGKTFELD